MHVQTTNAYKASAQDFLVMMQAISSKPPPPRRSVRFAAVVSCGISSSSTLTSEELSRLWYGFADLAAFKAQVKQLAKSGTKNHRDFDNRGLEHYSAERQKYRHMSIRCTLSAHKQGLCAADTALVASKCSAWNEEISRIQACQDFCQVYQPSMLERIPDISSIPSKFPFPMKKRIIGAEESAASNRRVRRRTQSPSRAPDYK